jgi:hypothetical protein
VTRWIIIGLFDALLECLILGLSIIVIFPLHMSVQRKVQASLCFILRLPYGKENLCATGTNIPLAPHAN